MPFTEWHAYGSRSTQKKTITTVAHLQALQERVTKQDAALKEIIKTVEAVVFFEGDRPVWRSIKRIAKAGRK